MDAKKGEVTAYTNWKDGASNNNDKDCASMEVSGGKWIDQSCDDERNGFFCGFGKSFPLFEYFNPSVHLSNHHGKSRKSFHFNRFEI